jgi:multiple sugar transport system substrate-binding protein
MDKQEMLDSKFKQGQLGLTISGGWNFKRIPKEVPNLEYGVAVIPKPAKDKGISASFGGGEIIVIPKGTKKRDAAIRFIKFLVREDNQIAICKGAKSAAPSFKGAENNAYYTANPNEAVMVRQLATAFPTPCHPKWNQIEEIVDEGIEMALHNKLAPEQALKQASDKIDLFLKNNPLK